MQVLSVLLTTVGQVDHLRRFLTTSAFPILSSIEVYVDPAIAKNIHFTNSSYWIHKNFPMLEELLTNCIMVAPDNLESRFPRLEDLALDAELLEWRETRTIAEDRKVLSALMDAIVMQIKRVTLRSVLLPGMPYDDIYDFFALEKLRIEDRWECMDMLSRLRVPETAQVTLAVHTNAELYKPNIVTKGLWRNFLPPNWKDVFPCVHLTTAVSFHMALHIPFFKKSGIPLTNGILISGAKDPSLLATPKDWDNPGRTAPGSWTVAVPNCVAGRIDPYDVPTVAFREIPKLVNCTRLTWLELHTPPDVQPRTEELDTNELLPLLQLLQSVVHLAVGGTRAIACLWWACEGNRDLLPALRELALCLTFGHPDAGGDELDDMDHAPCLGALTDPKRAAYGGGLRRLMFRVPPASGGGRLKDHHGAYVEATRRRAEELRAVALEYLDDVVVEERFCHSCHDGGPDYTGEEDELQLILGDQRKS